MSPVGISALLPELPASRLAWLPAMGNASDKVNAGAAASGGVTAILFVLQLVQDGGGDPQTIISGLFVFLAMIGTRLAGYYKAESNPAPSAKQAAIQDVAEQRRLKQQRTG